jgi:ABC-type cobalamin/Fe3+-siderophores transport system ATPase subunit
MNSLYTQNLGLTRNEKWLFRNLELSIPGGSLVAILGPSGVGKSSLLSCLSGSENPSEGKIVFKTGDESHTTDSINPNLGIIFQSLRRWYP